VNQTPVFTILSHLREIPLLPLGLDVPLPFQDQFYAPKKYCYIYKFWPASLPINKLTPSYCTLYLHSTCTCAYCSFCFVCCCCCCCCFYVVLLYLTFIWLSGRKDATKLINWLNNDTLIVSDGECM